MSEPGRRVAGVAEKRVGLREHLVEARFTVGGPAERRIAGMIVRIPDGGKEVGGVEDFPHDRQRPNARNELGSERCSYGDDHRERASPRTGCMHTGLSY